MFPLEGFLQHAFIHLHPNIRTKLLYFFVLAKFVALQDLLILVIPSFLSEAASVLFNILEPFVILCLPPYKVFSVWQELELFLPSVQTVRLGPPDPIDVTQTSSGRSNCHNRSGRG